MSRRTVGLLIVLTLAGVLVLGPVLGAAVESLTGNSPGGVEWGALLEHGLYIVALIGWGFAISTNRGDRAEQKVR